MIHMRFRLDLMVSSLSRKNHAEIEKKMTTPTLPPPCMTKLEEDTFQPQREFQYIVSVMENEVVHENHEHRDDTQQLDAGAPPFKILERAGVTRLICIPFKSVSWLLHR